MMKKYAAVTTYADEGTVALKWGLEDGSDQREMSDVKFATVFERSRYFV